MATPEHNTERARQKLEADVEVQGPQTEVQQAPLTQILQSTLGNSVVGSALSGDDLDGLGPEVAGGLTASAASLQELSELMDTATSGPSSALPHRTQIEAAWGRPLQIRVYTGPIVDQALAKMGAEGAARDDSIALKGGVSLLTVAHEVAHALQALGHGSAGNAEEGAESFASQVAAGQPATLTGTLTPGQVALKSYADQAAELFDDAIEAGGEMVDGALEAGTELGEDALIELIRAASPVIGELMDDGPEGLLEDVLTSGLDSFFADLCGGMTPEELFGEFGDTLTALTLAFQGDHEACAYLGTRLEGLNTFIEGFFASEEFGKLEATIQAIADKFEGLRNLVLAPLFDEVMAKMGERFGQVRAVAEAVLGAAATVQSLGEAAWAWVVDHFGLEVGTGEGFAAWFMDKAREVWDKLAEQLEPLKGPLTLIGAILAAASPFGVIVLIKEGLVPLMSAIGWLIAHADDPNLIENAREELGDTWLPTVLEGLEFLEKQLGNSVDPILAYFSELQGAVQGLTSALSGVASGLTGFVTAIAGTVTGIVSWVSSTWAALTAAVSGFTSDAFEMLRPILSVLGSLALFGAGFPLTSLAVVIGTGWPYLCPCLRVQILRVCLNTAIAAIESVELPGVLGSLQNVIKAFYEGLEARLVTDEAGVLVAFDNLAMIISGANPEFIVGFIGGLCVGVVEGILDPLLLIWDILSITAQIQYWAMCMAAGNVAAGLTAAMEIGEQALIDMTEDAQANLTPELMERFAELAQRLAPISAAIEANFQPAIDALMSGQSMTWEQLQGHFGTLWGAIESGLASQADALANGIIDGLQDPSGVSSTAGYALGWIIGTIVVEVVAVVCSFGILEAILGSSKAARLVIDVIEASEKALGAVFELLGKFADDVLDMIGKLATALGDAAKGALGEILELARRGFDEIKRFIDETIGLLFRKGDDVAEEVGEEVVEEVFEHGDDLVEAGDDLARHADDVRRPRKGKDGEDIDGDDPDGKRKDGDEDDTDEKRAARQAAQGAWGHLRSYAAKDLRTASEMKAKLVGEDRRVLGAAITYDLETSGSTWSVEAEASGDVEDLAAKRSAGSGWISRDGASEYFGDDSAESTSEAVADDVLEELEDSWQTLCDTVEGDEAADLQADGDRLAAAFDSRLTYERLEIQVDVGTPDFEEAEVRVEVAVAPSSTEVSRTLRGEGGEFEEMSVYFDMDGHGHTLYIYEGADGDAAVDMASRRAEYRAALYDAGRQAESMVSETEGADLAQWESILDYIDDLQRRLETFDAGIGTQLTEAKYGDDGVRKSMHRWMDDIAGTLRDVGAKYGIKSLSEVAAEGKWVIGSTLRQDFRDIRTFFYDRGRYSSGARRKKEHYVTEHTNPANPNEWLCPCCNRYVAKASERGEPTVEHVVDVTTHWNDRGRSCENPERVKWFSATDNHKTFCRSCNSKQPKGRFIHEVGPNFKGPDGLR